MLIRTSLFPQNHLVSLTISSTQLASIATPLLVTLFLQKQ